jgi:hypothetical protein
MKIETEPQKCHSTTKWQKQNWNQGLLILNIMIFILWQKEINALVPKRERVEGREGKREGGTMHSYIYQIRS